MKTIIKTYLAVIGASVVCLASPNAFGVSPAPDGCYPAFTTAEGCNALAGLSSGLGNTGLGWEALAFARSANLNTAVGAGALTLNTGDSNTAVGATALLLNRTGTNNVAIGEGALFNNVGGVQNTVVGSGAGQHLVNTGSDGNIYIGAGAGGAGDEVAFIRIGTPTIESFPYDTYIAGIFDRDVDSMTAHLVYADANQKIGTNLIDANGNRVPFKPQAMLDESLKQQKRIAELEATVERQQKGIEILTAQLKQQAAQIQRVSAQLELNRFAEGRICRGRPAPQTALATVNR